MQGQGGGDEQAQQQRQVPQMEEEVVGLFPLLALSNVGHSWDLSGG